ncbi:hypothetical protein GIB67_038618, partial [Kingdonia uniflora]
MISQGSQLSKKSIPSAFSSFLCTFGETYDERLLDSPAKSENSLAPLCFSIGRKVKFSHTSFFLRKDRRYENEIVRHSPCTSFICVRGDSLIDSGNNNFLQTIAVANYKPYGIDFSLGSTAESLGLPYVPAYLSLSNDEKSKLTTGVNYASGSAGILPETGTALGKKLGFHEQINRFMSTVANDLPKSGVDQYLSKSIFVISVGSNDYINIYIQPGTYNSSSIYNPRQYAILLLSRLEQGLRRLYSIGARKFVVFELGPLGCLPAVVNSANPKPITPCVEAVNKLVIIFNTKLPGTILKLRIELKTSTFVRGNIYQSSYVTSLRPSTF